MATFQLSRSAEADLLEIGSYTLGKWGLEQAIDYIDELESARQRLADRPTLGRSCEKINPELRRIEQGRHVIFYRPLQTGIFVSRILHERMLPMHHNMDDKECAPQI